MDLARRDRPRQRRHRGERLADDHQPRGVLVEPVDDAGARQRARSPDRARASALSSVPDQLPAAGWTTIPAGLVDHEQVVVLVDHGERQRLGPEGAALRGRLQASTAIRWPARTAAPRSSPAAPSTLHLAALDQLLQVGARELRRQARRAPCRAARHAAPRRRARRARSAAASSTSSPSASAAMAPCSEAGPRPYKIRTRPSRPFRDRAHPPARMKTNIPSPRVLIAVSAISLAAAARRRATPPRTTPRAGRRSASTPRPRKRPPPATTRRRSSSTSGSRAAPPARCSRSRRSSSAPTASGRAARRRRRCRRSSASSSCTRPARRSTTRSTCRAWSTSTTTSASSATWRARICPSATSRRRATPTSRSASSSSASRSRVYAEDARAAHELHRQLARRLRGARRALLLPPRRLRRGRQPGAAGGAGIPALAVDRGGARTSWRRATTGSA